MIKGRMRDYARLAAGSVAVFVLAGAAIGASAQPRFTVSADETEVSDARTGLVWRRCSAGQTFSGVSCTGTAGFFTHEQALTYARAQTGWRLPNVKELSSIVDIDRRDPSIDPVAFPGSPRSIFWSSSPLPGTPPGFALSVSFGVGMTQNSGLGNREHVRLVR